MPIYAEKKAGVLTGRFRVELQQGRDLRYRKRHDTLLQAQNDEIAVKAAWGRGEGADSAVLVLPVAPTHSIASVTKVASGALWRGQVQEDTAWAHMREMGLILGNAVGLDTIKTVDIDKVADELSKRGLQDSSVNRYLSHLRSFLEWATDREYMSRPAFMGIKFSWRAKVPGRIRWVTQKEEREMKAYLLGKGQEGMWKLIKVAIETGCRRGELMTVKLDQINGDRLHLWKTKTNAPRTVPMAPETTEMLRSLIVDSSMPSKRGLRSWWDRMALHMGLEGDEDFVFHICRHTCATRLVDAGVDILVIKEWLGHARLETTQRYAHVKPKNLQAALAKRGKYLADDD